MPRDATTTRRTLQALLGKLASAERLSRLAKLIVRDPRMLAPYLREAFQNAKRANSYAAWVAAYDTIRPEDAAILRAAASALRDGPLISLVMPVYNPPLRFLERAVQSIREQAYGNWELCMADDCSTAPEVAPFLQRLADNDSRIKICRRTVNGGIAAASNAALELVRGDYVALIDQDDEIPPHALLLVAHAVAADPAVDLIYTDEDKIDENGRRFDPYFKPDWNPALILSQNYFSHLGVYRRSLITRAGGFRDAFNGSQDYDLLLRCAELTLPERIHHIPHVLYHWRAIAGSAAKTPSAKPYAIAAGRRAVQDALDRRGIRGTVLARAVTNYAVRYERVRLPKVSVLVAVGYDLRVSERCLARLLEVTTYPDYEVLLLAPESARRELGQSALVQNVGKDARVRLLFYPERPCNRAWINNWGARQAQGAALCFMRDRVEVITPDWLEEMATRLALEQVGAVGPMLYNSNNTIRSAGTILGLGGIAGAACRLAPRDTAGYYGRATLERDISSVTAACCVVAREAFESVGGFDERFAIDFGDVDLSLRLGQAGWRILRTPTAEVYVHQPAGDVSQDPAQSRQHAEEEMLMRETWGMVLEQDGDYNPNLSLEANQSFQLAFPPRVDWRTSVVQTRLRSDAAHKAP
jgi:GT2 family glycosyltransferase